MSILGWIKDIFAKARKVSLTTVLVAIELVVILVGLTGIFVTTKEIRLRLRTMETGIQRAEKYMLSQRYFKINSPCDGDSVAMVDRIQGDTPFLAMHHYLIVTSVKIGVDVVQEEAIVSLGGSWCGQAKFGDVAVEAGEKYVVRVIATEATLSPGSFILRRLPEGAIFALGSITVIRKK